MHCVAGDATGIIIAAIILSMFTLSNGVDIVFEYVAAFICGLFIFQALMMRSMYNNNYWLAVQKTFFAETVSMNFVMIGMVPVMVLLSRYLSESRNPLQLGFWFRMDMAVVLSLLTAFPINYWLVAKKLKHGCMTLPSTKQKMTMPKKMEMNTLSLGKQTIWIIFTFLLLFIILYFTNRFVPITF